MAFAIYYRETIHNYYTFNDETEARKALEAGNIRDIKANMVRGEITNPVLVEYPADSDS